MAENNAPVVRMVSITVVIRSSEISADNARALEDRLRDVADDYPDVEVSATSDKPRTF